jgi:hypothetical protein
MPSSLGTIVKTKIKEKLDALVTSGVLKCVVIDDLKKNASIDGDIPSFPAAILVSPSSDGSMSTNRSNLRTYTFAITIVQKAENIESSEDIEYLSDQILDAFDNDPTLSGAAVGGLEPSNSEPTAVTSQDKSYIVFTVTLKAHADKTLTF